MQLHHKHSIRQGMQSRCNLCLRSTKMIWMTKLKSMLFQQIQTTLFCHACIAVNVSTEQSTIYWWQRFQRGQLTIFWCQRFHKRRQHYNGVNVTAGYFQGWFIGNHFNHDMHHVYGINKRKRKIKASFQESKNLL